MLKRHARKNTLTVWDIGNNPSKITGSLLHWQSYSESENDCIYSILKIVECEPDKFRSQYLSFIYELGDVKLNGVRVVDYLEIRQEFSYWWMTLLTEKCNISKSPQIDNAIKFMAFVKWLKVKNFELITLVSDNIALAKAFKLLSTELLIDFKWKKAKKIKQKISLLKVVRNILPYPIQAIVSLTKHLVSRWRLKGVGVYEWKESKATTTFVSYLFNLVPESVVCGKFDSRYWGKLPNILTENHVRTNWLHIYVKDDLLPNVYTVRDFINNLNQSSNNGQVHVTLHSFLNYQIIFYVIKDWLWLIKRKNMLSKALKKQAGVYWSFIELDYQDSIVGPTAINNLLYFHLFHSAMKMLPKQVNGVYLKENQGWEFGFISAWRAANHSNNLIGVPHTPSKFWDLRSYFDPRSYVTGDKNMIPLPDYVGVNGVASKNMYIEGGYPKVDLVEVEALRYLYLDKIKIRKYSKEENNKVGNTILILGDYSEKKTSMQMSLLQKAIKSIHKEIKCIVKPHPANQIKSEDYPELNLTVSNEPIPSLVEKYTLVYTSSTTSSAVDAYCAGRIVITILDPSGLNLSPLRGNEGVIFASSPEELAMVINKIDEMIVAKDKGKDYFYLDTELPRWKKLLIDSNENMECGV